MEKWTTAVDDKLLEQVSELYNDSTKMLNSTEMKEIRKNAMTVGDRKSAKIISMAHHIVAKLYELKVELATIRHMQAVTIKKSYKRVGTRVAKKTLKKARKR